MRRGLPRHFRQPLLSLWHRLDRPRHAPLPRASVRRERDASKSTPATAAVVSVIGLRRPLDNHPGIGELFGLAIHRVKERSGFFNDDFARLLHTLAYPSGLGTDVALNKYDTARRTARTVPHCRIIKTIPCLSQCVDLGDRAVRNDARGDVLKHCSVMPVNRPAQAVAPGV